MSTADAAAPVVKVLVYSDDANIRAEIRLAIGRRPAADLPELEYVECATEPAVFALLDKGGIDVMVLDGEARPGGLGMIRQAKDEIYQCPPALVLIGRRDDGWLATWSRADAVVARPLDPMALAAAATDLVRQRIASTLPVL